MHLPSLLDHGQAFSLLTMIELTMLEHGQEKNNYLLTMIE